MLKLNYKMSKYKLKPCIINKFKSLTDFTENLLLYILTHPLFIAHICVVIN